MSTVIVLGVFRVDPAERDAYLAASVDNMRASRAEQGCLEYVLAADPVDEGRIILSERWASRPDLDAHIQGLAARRSAGALRAEATSGRKRSAGKSPSTRWRQNKRWAEAAPAVIALSRRSGHGYRSSRVTISSAPRKVLAQRWTSWSSTRRRRARMRRAASAVDTRAACSMVDLTPSMS